MAINKANIAIKDNAQPGYLNVVVGLISKAQDNQTKIEIVEAIAALEQSFEGLQILLQSDDAALDTLQEVVDKVNEVAAFIATIDTNGELSALIDTTVGGSWWRTDFTALITANFDSIVVLQQNLTTIQNILQSDDAALDTFQEVVDKVNEVAAFIATIDTNGELSTLIDTTVGGTWWRSNDFVKKGLTTTAGTVITFDEGRKYGYPNAISGPITYDFANAVENTPQLVRHNSNAKPNLPEAQTLELLGQYQSDVNNYMILTPIKVSSNPDVWEVHIEYKQNSIVSSLPSATVTTADNAGTLEGAYVYSDPDGTEENNEPPTAENIVISGDPTPGSLLTLNYDFISPGNYTEGAPIIQWKRKDKNTLIEEVITGENSLTYQTVVGDNAFLVYADLIVTQTAPAPANSNTQSEQFTSNELLIEVVVSELFKLNLGGSVAVPNWINYNIGDGALNDINGSGINVSISDAFQSDNNAGAITGDDSGIVPDNVLLYSFRVGPTDNVAQMTFTGFNANQPTIIKLGGSRSSGNQLTVVTVNGDAQSYDPSNNTTVERTYEVNANAQGEIIIDITTNPINNNGYFGWIKIEA